MTNQLGSGARWDRIPLRPASSSARRRSYGVEYAYRSLRYLFATFVLPAAWHFVVNWEKRPCTPPDSPTGGSWHDESRLTGCLMSQATVTLLAGKRARPPAARTLRIPPVMLRQSESVDML
jgi:hypothetical protein